MKFYRPVPNKTISMVKMIKASQDSPIPNTAPTRSQAARFCIAMSALGYRPYDDIPIDDKFIEYASNNECFMAYLENNGYITMKLPFEPVTIVIETLDEFKSTYHRLNINGGNMDFVFNWEQRKALDSNTFSQLSEYKKKHNIDVSL